MYSQKMPNFPLVSGVVLRLVKQKIKQNDAYLSSIVANSGKTLLFYFSSFSLIIKTNRYDLFSNQLLPTNCFEHIN